MMNLHLSCYIGSMTLRHVLAGGASTKEEGSVDRMRMLFGSIGWLIAGQSNVDAASGLHSSGGVNSLFTRLGAWA